jgi:5-methylcytosine-specific restriction endonuclease McrA
MKGTTTMTTSVIQRPTLVLNRNWQPVGVATVARALVKVFTEQARVVDPVDYQLYTWQDWSELRPAAGDAAVRTQRFSIRVPEVITLTKYDKLPANAVAFSRRNVFNRDRFACQYCGGQPGSEELTIDHVVPRAQGGQSTWTNCVLACVACNHRKADRTPDQARMPLKSQPVRPVWRPVYAARGGRIESWAKFVSDAYWNVELES